MRSRTVELVFIWLILLCLLAAPTLALLRPKTINYYENRFADRPVPFSPDAYLDGSFQAGMESGLSDQIPGAQRLKKVYHLAFSAFLRPLAERLSDRLPDQYVQLGSLTMFNRYLCFYPRYQDLEREALDRRVANYSEVFSARPETEFYLYYIEKDTDLDLSTGVKTAQVYEYLAQRLDLPAGHMGCLRVDSFDDYAAAYRRTDHHWNQAGAYQGYTDILSMLAPEETPLRPMEELYVGDYAGSKAVGRSQAAFSEPFYAYRFAFPAMEVSINGYPAEDYGAQDIYLNGQASDLLTYGNFYGDDQGAVRFRNPEKAGHGTLLVLGDSFDNAIVKLLAAHFEETWAVDLRFYENYMGSPFHLGQFLAEHPDTKVLLNGNIDYFVSDEFLLED